MKIMAGAFLAIAVIAIAASFGLQEVGYSSSDANRVGQYDWIEAMVEYLGLWVLIALAVNMWAMISVVGAPASLPTKALWTVILLLPAIGFVFWYMVGPRRPVP